MAQQSFPIDLNMENVARVRSMLDPLLDQDAATKKYVDDRHLPFRVTTAATSTSTTYASVTELTTGVLPVGHYAFRVYGLHQSTAGATGIGVRVGAGTATLGVTHAKWFFDQGINGTGKNFQYGQVTATDNITSASVQVANVNQTFTGWGYFNVTAQGTVAIQLRSETAGTAVSLRPGTVFIVERVV
jgi:hypothetical protein